MTEEAKQDSRWRKQFMDLEREKARKYREGKAEGLLEGAQQNAIENAKRMLQDKLSIDKTSQYSGLPHETVQELQKTLKTNT